MDNKVTDRSKRTDITGSERQEDISKEELRQARQWFYIYGGFEQIILYTTAYCVRLISFFLF